LRSGLHKSIKLSATLSSQVEKPELQANSVYQICSVTVLDTTVPGITFNEKGACHFCDYYDELAKRTVLRDPALRKAEYETAIRTIKQLGSKKKYDCILGISGGMDSTYLAWLAKKEGLRPLLVHFDNGWNSELAVKNIENIVNILGFDLHTFVMDWEEFRDLQRAYFEASVVDVEVPTDQLIFAALNRIAYQNNIKYILAGNNVVCESINPDGWVYKRKLDLVNLRDIHAKYGQLKLRKLPRLGIIQRYFYEAVAGLQTVNLLDLIDYNKAEVKKLIEKELNWRDYGGKHYESVFTRFYQGYYLPTKFNIDKRKAHLSNLILSKQITREEALTILQTPTYPEKDQKSDLRYVIKKLGFSESEWEAIMSKPPVDHQFFKTENDFSTQAFYFVFRALMYVPVRLLRWVGLLSQTPKIGSQW
jgi:N-acetyl sugar amidotransferase